jgi:copper chaperone CopZ
MRTFARRLFTGAALAAALSFAAPAALPSAALACGDKTAEPAKPVPKTADTVVIPVDGMTCGSCANKIRNVLVQLDGVFDATVSVEGGNATVSFDAKKVAVDKLVDAIAKAGYKPGKPTKPQA